MTASFIAGAMKSDTRNGAPSLMNFVTSVAAFRITTLCAMATFGIVPVDTSRRRRGSPARALMVVTLNFMSSPPVRSIVRGGSAGAPEKRTRNEIARNRMRAPYECGPSLHRARPALYDRRHTASADRLDVDGPD